MCNNLWFAECTSDLRLILCQRSSVTASQAAGISWTGIEKVEVLQRSNAQCYSLVERAISCLLTIPCNKT